ncbi:MAG: hypothetical protein EP347_07020 [Alphaproteobacteria bacterium]|nr:MAG: hypothetical protein EP347_07020 [Alphaproteobacteria bacterium]
MTQNQSIQQIIQALQERNRGLAASHIRELLVRNAPLGDQWLLVAKLAVQIGERDLALQAADAFGWVDTQDPQRIVARAGFLAEVGNLKEALAWVEPLLETIGEDPILLHFCGTAYSQFGQLDEALDYLRRALDIEPLLGPTWLTLAALKTFTDEDPEYVELEELYVQMAAREPANRAPYLYALGKARSDIGDFPGAYEAYAKGAKLRKKQGAPFQFGAEARQVQEIISSLDRPALEALKPNYDQGSSTIFVLGWPRSGTTLLEQILTSHSRVSDGGELNLFGQAHLEVGGLSHEALSSFASHFEAPELAWQRISATYAYMLKQKFGSHSVLVDKSLNNARFLGSIYLTQPNAPIIWMDRNPADAAWSCFHTYFNQGLPWSWSFDEIGQYFRLERALMEHWQNVLGDKVLRVPYEELVSHPDTWIPRVLEHCFLPMESGVERFYETDRAVLTASVAQVRRPLSKLSIGASRPYHKWMQAFFTAS